MKLLILSAFLCVCIYALPQRYNFDISLENVKITNIPDIKTPLVKYVLEQKKLEGSTDDCTLAALLDQDAANSCADGLFEIADNYLSTNYDPLGLPDAHEGFNYTLIITYHGELDMTNGKLIDFSTIHRNGDIQITTGTAMSLDLPMAFNDLSIQYDYSAKIMGLGPTGGITAKVKELTMELKLSFDITQNQLSLDSFDITSSGHISVDFSGNSLIDWLLELLTNVVTAVLKKVLLNVIEEVVGGGLQAAVDAINEILANNTLIANPETQHKQVIESYPYFVR